MRWQDLPGGLLEHHPSWRRLVFWSVVDAGIVIFAYSAVFFGRTFVSFEEYWQDAWAIVLAAAITVLMYYLWGVYHRIWTRTSGHGVRVIVEATVVSSVIVLIIDLLVPGSRPLPISVVILGSLLAMMGVVGLRYRSRLISGFEWRWHAVWRQEFPDVEKPTRVLIVGAGEAGQILMWRFTHRWPSATNNKYDVIGFVDDDPGKLGYYIEELPVLGTRHDIPKIVQDRKIDLIVIAIHNVDGPNFREILNLCEETDARIKVVPDAFDAVDNTSHVQLLRDLELEDFLGRKPIGRHEAVDLSPVMHKVVLVTGAAGSIGSELCRQILQYDPVMLVMVDNNESGLHDLSIELCGQAGSTRLIPVLADVTQPQTIEQVFIHHAPQVVFHAAAYKHVPMMELYPYEAVRVNVGGTRHVAQFACDYNAERFVLISTDKAVAPTSVMGASKRLCEILVHAVAKQCQSQTLYSVVRFGNVLGSRGSVVPTFMHQIDAGGPVTVTHPEMSRFFMTIPEAVNLVIHAACLTDGDDLFMLQMGDEVKIAELAERMIRMRGLRPYKDIHISFTGLRPGEKLHEVLQFGDETATPTVHPDILLLNSRQRELRPKLFFKELQQVMQVATPTAANYVDDAGIRMTTEGPRYEHTEHAFLATLEDLMTKAYPVMVQEPEVLKASENGHSANEVRKDL